jgi:aldose sugar dehydrogenase
MRARILAFVAPLLVVVLLIVACGDNGDDSDPTPTPDPSPTEAPESTPTPRPTPTPEPTATEPPDDDNATDDDGDEPESGPWVDFDTEVLATGLEIPWEIAFLPNGDIFITERPGRVRLFRDGELDPEPILEFPDVEHVPAAEAGLCGMTLHPDFEENGWIYFYYTYRDEEVDDLRNRVVRYVVDGAEFSDRTVILDDLYGAFTHNGGRIKFGPDDKLYITIGDAQRHDDAQDIDVLVGKVLRLNDDGSVPDDNPFPDSPVFAYGLRNPQGLAWHPETGELYAPQHGPTGNDELNRIEAGHNYAWPFMEGLDGEYREEFTLPVLASGQDTWAPSGAAFVAGDTFPQWTNQLLIAGLRSVTLYYVDFEKNPPEMGPIIQGHFGRFRTVVEGPDGYIYFITSNRDERMEPGPDDDRLVRIIPTD